MHPAVLRSENGPRFPAILDDLSFGNDDIETRWITKPHVSNAPLLVRLRKLKLFQCMVSIMLSENPKHRVVIYLERFAEVTTKEKT